MTDTSVALLGVKGGPAIKPGSNMPSSTLLQMNSLNILVDAGLGVTRAVCDQGLALTEIDLIIITHLHSDHYLELGALFHTAWVAGLRTPIPVIGPAGLNHYWTAFLSSMQYDINLRIEDEGRCDLAGLTRISEISEGLIYDQNAVKITALRNRHPPIRDSFALKFEACGKKIVLSGDTTYFAEMIAFADQADLLVHEVLLEAGVDALCASLGVTDDRLKQHLMRSHTAAPDVGRIARLARVRRLALNHFVPGADDRFSPQDWEVGIRQTWDGPLTIGTDGLKIDL
ncbi:MBL fold metallo-hydrolase [uncultured Roseovarius sp.]|uniref:MBL fold metallo-hydrolase n=1 Tax=uncultured Roseovarius sp. TaxID=293344 RepID=UPI00262D9B6B|nr:MBL fold metallo-hydrolase [uncultured Roseovarius sp.]